MTDVVDKATRSRMMANIQGKDTKQEVLIRKALHRRGYRFKLHDKKLAGKPDLVFPKFKSVIQIQGCFWHCHDCHLFKWPTTRKEFWRNKIESNVRRDERNQLILRGLGWKILIIWECATKGKEKMPFQELIRTIEYWLINDNLSEEIRGRIK